MVTHPCLVTVGCNCTAGVPSHQIGAVLAVAAVLNWRLFDGTPQGLALAALCGIGAPVSELVLMKYLGLWHYENPGAPVNLQ